MAQIEKRVIDSLAVTTLAYDGWLLLTNFDRFIRFVQNLVAEKPIDPTSWFLSIVAVAIPLLIAARQYKNHRQYQEKRAIPKSVPPDTF